MNLVANADIQYTSASESHRSNFAHCLVYFNEEQRLVQRTSYCVASRSSHRQLRVLVRNGTPSPTRTDGVVNEHVSVRFVAFRFVHLHPRMQLPTSFSVSVQANLGASARYMIQRSDL